MCVYARRSFAPQVWVQRKLGVMFMQRKTSKPLGPLGGKVSVGGAGGKSSAAGAETCSASTLPASGMWDTRCAQRAVGVPKLPPPPSSSPAPAIPRSRCSDADSSTVVAVAVNPDSPCVTCSSTGAAPVVALPDQFQDMLRVPASGTWSNSIECAGSATLRQVTVLSESDTGRVADVDLQAQCLDDWGEFVDSRHVVAQLD